MQLRYGRVNLEIVLMTSLTIAWIVIALAQQIDLHKATCNLHLLIIDINRIYFNDL